MATYLPKFSLIALIFKKPIVIIYLTISTVAVMPVVDFYKACTMLVILFIADAITGLGASYCDWKKLKVKKDKTFWGKSGEGFSSDKAKKMGTKALVYMAVPIFFIRFQDVFHVKKFKFESLSSAEMDVATLLILGACAIELYSIFKENLPKCGIDVFGQIHSMLTTKEKLNNINNNNIEEDDI